MSRQRMPGLTKKKLAGDRFEWYIDKRVRGYGRLRESCRTGDVTEAEAHLARRLKEIRRAIEEGIRPRIKFRVAATKYLNDEAKRRGIGRDAGALAKLDPYVGEMYLDEVHDGTFEKFREVFAHQSIDTINRDLGAVIRVLGRASRLWRHAGTTLSWLAQEPKILLKPNPKKRDAYPLSWDEQRLLFSELAVHLQAPALFDVNTGLRDQELCALEWAWEQRVPELDTESIKRSVFVLPGDAVKNLGARVVVLNDVAQSVIEGQRGLHPRFVFTVKDVFGRSDRFYTLRNTGWHGARRRAAARYLKELKTEPPAGFAAARVHDLRHTFGRRLRAAGVSLEDRQDLLGHKAGRITTHYSAAEIGNLVDAANKVANVRSSPTMTMLRVVKSDVRA